MLIAKVIYMKKNRTIKWMWYADELTNEQAAKLQAAMLLVFRFYLRFAVPMIGWHPRKKIFWVKLHPDSPNYVQVKAQISNYIAGYCKALEK